MIKQAVAACIVLASSLAVGGGVAGAVPAAPCAASPSSIAVVVDFGDGSQVSAVCVDADSTDNGAEVLAARAQQLGTPAPRFNPSTGLLCAIDGAPASGCGDQNGGTYAYWAYSHGTAAGWSHSSVGPAGSRAKPSVTEGWRFHPQGAGNPSDPPPRGSPDPAATCVPAPPPTTPGSTEPASSPTDAAPGNVPTSSVSAGADPSSTEATTESSPASSSPSASASGYAAAAGQGDVRVSDENSESSPWSAVGAGAVIVGLGTGGVLIARRRNAFPP